MNLVFDPIAKEHLDYWKNYHPKIAIKIVRMLEEALLDPFHGLGKPEPLKHELSGCWSRRIDREHRLVYKVEDNTLIILSCRYHY